MTALKFADCHNDLLLGVLHQKERGIADPFGDFWLPQLKAGNVVLQVLPV
jgi:membrane dipeptidase